MLLLIYFAWRKCNIFLIAVSLCKNDSFMTYLKKAKSFLFSRMSLISIDVLYDENNQIRLLPVQLVCKFR